MSNKTIEQRFVCKSCGEDVKDEYGAYDHQCPRTSKSEYNVVAEMLGGELPSSNLVAGQAPRTERENHLAALGMRLRTIGDVPPLPAEEALWLLDELNKSEAEIERLTAERDEAERLADLRLGYKVQRDRLRAAQAEAVRILSAIEFDGQAYEAIQRACELLEVAADSHDKLETVQQNKLKDIV